MDRGRFESINEGLYAYSLKLMSIPLMNTTFPGVLARYLRACSH
jgi:hypothetical protein